MKYKVEDFNYLDIVSQLNYNLSDDYAKRFEAAESQSYREAYAKGMVDGLIRAQSHLTLPEDRPNSSILQPILDKLAKETYVWKSNGEDLSPKEQQEVEDIENDERFITKENWLEIKYGGA